MKGKYAIVKIVPPAAALLLVLLLLWVPFRHPIGSVDGFHGDWKQRSEAWMRRTESRITDDYLTRLLENERLPLVFLDVSIKGEPIGRVEAVLFADVSPRHAENFRRLVTGEVAGPDNRPLTIKGASFYRIIHGFIDQAGINTGSAINGGAFRDDAGGLQLRHDRAGILSSANTGPDTNTAHFSIMMGPAPHLDGSYTIFGQVISGYSTIQAINDLSRGKPDNTATAEEGALIYDVGMLRRGDPSLTTEKILQS